MTFGDDANASSSALQSSLADPEDSSFAGIAKFIIVSNSTEDPGVEKLVRLHGSHQFGDKGNSVDDHEVERARLP